MEVIERLWWRVARGAGREDLQWVTGERKGVEARLGKCKLRGAVTLRLTMQTHLSFASSQGRKLFSTMWRALTIPI